MQLDCLPGLRVLSAAGAAIAWDASERKGKLAQLLISHLQALQETHSLQVGWQAAPCGKACWGVSVGPRGGGVSGAGKSMCRICV
jgi:hypothetical protein